MTEVSWRRGGRRSPDDPLFKDALKRIVLEAGPAFLFAFIGYDNSVVKRASTEANAQRFATRIRDDYCVKAVLKVEPKGADGFRATVLSVGADAVYAFNLNMRTGRVAWCEPREFDAISLRAMRDW